MPEYICECCAFKSRDKTLYKKHLETLKHKKLSNSMEGDDKQLSLINENTILKEENNALKKELQIYKQVIKDLGIQLKSEEEEELYNWDPSQFLERISIDVLDEALIEEIAGMRTADDLVGEVNIENAFEAFFYNERNNLPLIKDYLKMLEDPMHVGDVVIEKVLNECSFKITKRNTFSLYKDGWLKPSKSAELLEDLIVDVRAYIGCNNKLWQYYYSYNSKERRMDKSKFVDLEPKIKEYRHITSVQTKKIVEYICEKMSD